MKTLEYTGDNAVKIGDAWGETLTFSEVDGDGVAAHRCAQQGGEAEARRGVAGAGRVGEAFDAQVVRDGAQFAVGGPSEDVRAGFGKGDAAFRDFRKRDHGCRAAGR